MIHKDKGLQCCYHKYIFGKNFEKNVVVAILYSLFFWNFWLFNFIFSFTLMNYVFQSFFYNKNLKKHEVDENFKSNRTNFQKIKP